MIKIKDSEKSYTALTIGLCIVILLVTLSYYYSQLPGSPTLTEDTKFDGDIYPKGSLYTVDSDGDIIIELVNNTAIGKGRWNKGSKFYFDGNKLGKIFATGGFEFAEIKFQSATEIYVEDYPPNILHKIKIMKNLKIDGLILHSKCHIEFKNHILYAAYCPEFETVYFKRFIRMPEIIEY